MENEFAVNKILIADDEAANLQILISMLNELGATIIIARNGKEVMERLRSTVPDLLLLDVIMPEMNGFDTCTAIKNDERLKDIPVIFMTALSDIDDRKKGFDVGAADYISKPFQPEELLSRIKVHLNNRNLQQRLRETNKNLEYLVEQRTGELNTMNEALIHEIEERKVQNQKLLQTEKLIALAELSAGIAHEVNQPLSVISLGLSNIRHELTTKGYDKDKLLTKIAKLEKNVQRIDKIIEHVRIFSHEQNMEQHQIFNVHTSIEAALSLIGTQYNSHNIAIHKDFACTNPMLKGNPYQFEQVILNLLSNARYAIEQKVQVQSSKKIDYTKEIAIKTFRDNDVVSIEIKDNGIGIPEHNINKVLNPFFTTKPVNVGTGLGLSVSYSIIKNMKGTIEIESREGEYTIFTLVFKDRPHD